MSKSAPAAIVVDAVSKRFGDFTAVDNLSLTIPAGQLFALLGPNGAGKSTTIKMLTTLLRPTSGQILLNGYDVVRQQTAARRNFGIVFQDPSLDMELTATENLRLHAALYSLSAKHTSQQIDELLSLVELTDRADIPVKQFSGGMKRRLEIARGLLHRPHILFLDEPTLGLDTQTRRLLWRYVRDLSHKTALTVLFSTHYLEEAEEVADAIAIIDHGQIIARGTAADLRRQTKTKSLEDAYLQLTGSAVRDQTTDGRGGFASQRKMQNLR